MYRVCLVTPAHLSVNPRLVKEADALVGEGYEVQVFACQYIDWAREADKTILERAKWRVRLLRWKSDVQPYLFWKSKLRQYICRHLLKLLRSDHIFDRGEEFALRAYDRVIPELRNLVLQHPADLYIAHNLQALPIAVLAAEKHDTRVGFDAEDFHSGMRPFGSTLSLTDSITEYFEKQYLPRCDYITAAAPGIAKAYISKYDISNPISILNVFPLSHRPRDFRVSNGNGPLSLYWFSQTIGANRGLEDVVKAMGLLKSYEIELHLRGDWQERYRERLFGLATRVGLYRGRIISHKPAPPGEMTRLASRFDVGLAVEPGRDGNNEVAVSNKLFTYLLAGNAILATSTAGQLPIMDTICGAGLCYEPGNISLLAECLRHWYVDRGALEAARLNAWDWGTRRYNWDLEKKKFLHVIEKALAGS